MSAAALSLEAFAIPPVLAEGFQFHPPSLPWIHLAWLVPALLLLYLYSFYRKKVALGIFASEETLRHLIPSVSWARQYAKCALVLGAVLALSIAIARPQWGTAVEEIRRKGIDLVVCLDISKSMLAEDMPPNRLEWAKADLGELLGALAGDRVGLVAFAGRAEIRSPLTFDYGFFRRILGELRVGSVHLGGTAIGLAISKGLECFQDTVKNHKAILLITDGEDHEAFVKDAAEKAREKGVRIFSIGVGDTGEGKRIPITDEQGNKVYLKDKEGKEVWTKMDPRVLLEAAEVTDGGYAPAYSSKEGNLRGEVTTVRDIYGKILEKVRKKELEGAKETRYKDRFQWFLALAFALLALEPLVRTRKREPAPAGETAPAKGRGAARIQKVAPLFLATLLLVPGTARAGDFAGLLKEGNRLYAEGKYAEAEAKYLEAKTERQTAPEVPYNIGNTYFQREDFPKAMESFDEALNLVREDRELEIRIRYNLACARSRESEKFVGDLSSAENLQKGVDLLRQAIAGFRDVLELDHQHGDARKNLAIAQLRVKNLLDDLKRLREEAEKKAKEENKDKKDPVEVLKELIAEEKAEIDLTAGAGKDAAEIGRIQEYRDRIIDLQEALKSIPKAGGEAKEGARDQALESLFSKMEGLLKDPGFTTGGAEASEGEKLLRSGDEEGGAKKLAEAGERILKEAVERKEALEKSLQKDRTDQGATMGKAMGLVQGLRNLAEGKTGPPPAAGAQPPPPPEPLQPEVKDRLLEVARLTEEAGGKMGEALGRLGSAEAKPSLPPELPKAESSQRAALELLEKALEEAEKLPKKEPPPQDQEKKEEKKEGKKDSEKKEGKKDEKKDEDRKDEKKAEKKEEKGQGKDDKKEKKEEQKMSKEEAQQALRKFLEKDEERRRDKERRALGKGGMREALEKDW